MPAVSRRQQRYLFAHFGEAWVKKHHFDNHITGVEPPKKKKRAKRK